MELSTNQPSLKNFFKPKDSSTTEAKKPPQQEKIVFPDVPGLSMITNYVTEAEEKVIWQEVYKYPWITDYKRRFQMHGYSYDIKTRHALEYQGELPPSIAFLADRLKEEKLMPERPDQSVVNEYEPGQGIASHIDTGMFGNEIANISLGSDIVMDYYGPENQKKSILLPRRSLLMMEGVARHEWKHGIALRKTDKLDNGTVLKRGKRISVTLRIAKKEQNKYLANRVEAPQQ